MANKLTDAKREEMFLAWQEKQNINYVQVKCGFHHATIKKYRILDNWDERLRSIKVKATRKVDTALVNHRAAHAQIGKLCQVAGTRRIKKILDDPDKDAILEIDPRLAKDLIKDGITIEKEAVGDVAPDTVVVLALPVGLENL